MVATPCGPAYHGPVGKNPLSEIDLETARELVPRRRKRKRYEQGTKTRIAADVRSRKRMAPGVPKNKALSEIVVMDADDPVFKILPGMPRKIRDPNNWRELAREDKMVRARARRAKTRKWEAEVVVAARTMEKHVSSRDREMDLFDEDRAIAEDTLSLESWDVEELVRGYRRGRNGKFGVAPKYIPREVQQAAFRALVNKGDRRLKQAYYKTIEELVHLAHNADSEKVRLEATKELMNRVVGKVADKVMVAREEPWEGILADSLVPIGSEGEALDLEMDEDGVARALPPGQDEYESGGEELATSVTGAAPVNPGSGGSAPSSPPSTPTPAAVVEEVRVIPGKKATKKKAGKK